MSRTHSTDIAPHSVWRWVALCVGGLLVGIAAAQPVPLPELGRFEWTVAIDSGNGSDAALGVAIDSEGNVIAAGFLQGVPLEGRSAYAVKYSPAGNTLWSVTEEQGEYDPALQSTQNLGKHYSDDVFYDTAVDEADNVFLGGSISGVWAGYVDNSYHTGMLLRRYSPAGALAWERIYHDTSGSAWQHFARLTVGPGNSVYGAGTALGRWGGVEYRWIALKYDEMGTLTLGPLHYNHSPFFHLPDNAHDIALDADGNIIVIGRIGIAGESGSPVQDYDWHVRKYAPDGTLLWSQTRDTGQLNDQALAVAVLPGSNSIVVGGMVNRGSDNADQADYDWQIVRYDAQGMFEGAWTYGRVRIGANDVCRDLLAAPDGTLYAAGDTTDGSGKRIGWVVRLDPSDWALLAQSFPEGVTYVTALDLRDGKLALAGYGHNGTDHDFWTALMRLHEPKHEAAEPHHGEAGRALFDSWVDAPGGTLIDFESLPAPSALATELSSQGVVFRSTYDPPAANNPIDRHVVVRYRNETYGNVIIGSPSWGGTTGHDGRVVYQVEFASPQRWAGIDRVWYSVDTITRFYNEAGELLYAFNSTGNESYEAYFHGLWMKSDDPADWIARIELDGIPAGAERNVGDADNLVFGTTDPDGIDPCAEPCSDPALDSDGDGLSDCFECEQGYDWNNPDTDGDGMDDGWEHHHGLDPLVNDAHDDLDDDGYTNLEEYLRGSDPADPDSPLPNVHVATSGSDLTGDGSLGAPFRSIQHALESLAPTQANPARILLHGGTYMEFPTLKPWTTIAGMLGEVPVIRGMVTGAHRARIENLEIMANDDGAHTLLTAANVAMELEGVVFRGSNARAATGMLSDGAAGAGSLVAQCSFINLNVGLHLRDGIPIVRRCFFTNPRRAAILVEGVLPKASAKNFGDASDPRTGWNTFRIFDASALAVENSTANALVMQNNDWGVDTAEEALLLMNGDVQFEPFLAVGDAILAAAVFCRVQNWATQLPILDASVTLTPSSYQPVTENKDGVYGFPAIAPATYTLAVSAPGYGNSSLTVSVGGGELSSVIVTLLEGAAEGEGEGEGEKPGLGCGVGGGQSSIPGDGVVLGAAALLLLILWRRRCPTGH